MTDMNRAIDPAIRDAAIEEAQVAFWAVIVKHYPEVPSGDMDPGGSFAFSSGCDEALDRWLRWNHPTHPDRDEDDA
jgi:hypothetical protein